MVTIPKIVRITKKKIVTIPLSLDYTLIIKFKY